MQKTFHLLIKSINAISYLWDSFFSFCYKRAMGSCGKNVLLKPSSSIFKGLENIHIANHVRIARYAVIYTTNANLYIGSKVGIAPYLKIITGNHRIDGIGHFMFDGDIPKQPEDDRDVIIEGDSWFGINVTLLSGVTIGRGSVIASGAVVNKSCPPYSIIGGVPAQILKYRFTIEEALEHEEKLYPEYLRYTRQELEESRSGAPFNPELSRKHLLRL